MGANSTIVCGVEIGEYAFAAAGAVVTTDIKPYALVAGVPARQIGWMSKKGHKLDLPLTGNASTEEAGEYYEMVDGRVSSWTL